MTVTWLALAAALLLVPVPGPAVARVRALASRAVTGPGLGVVADEPGSRAALLPHRFLPALIVFGAGGLVVAVALMLGPGLGLAAAIAVLTAGHLARAARATRRDRRRRGELLVALRLLVTEIESGARPPAALAAAGAAAASLRTEFAAAARAAGAGEPVADGLLATAELAPLGHAWQVSEAGGAPLGEVLAGVTADLAARDETRRAVAAAVAGARSSAGLLAGLPLLGVGLGAAMGAHPLAFLTGSPGGHATACAGVVLEAVGLLWTHHLVRRAEAT